jgi:hypothetical protein
MDKTQDWYWAAANDGAAGDRFVIENGQARLWPRVRQEIAADERCLWMPVQELNAGSRIEDILNMMLTVVLPYGVSLNRFVLEAAKIPVFAQFLRDAPHDLGNYVSNPVKSGVAIKMEPYSEETKNRLGQIVSETLGIEDDWYD